jgi:excisionase family DNA binding protein
MPDKVATALRGGETLLGVWGTRAVATLVERQVNRERANGLRGGPLDELLEVLRVASARGCATQPPQPVAEDTGPWWAASDEIDVEEAARLMGTTTSNVRTRCRRRTLGAVKVGGEWVLSRQDVLARAAERKAS